MIQRNPCALKEADYRETLIAQTLAKCPRYAGAEDISAYYHDMSEASFEVANDARANAAAAHILREALEKLEAHLAEYVKTMEASGGKGAVPRSSAALAEVQAALRAADELGVSNG